MTHLREVAASAFMTSPSQVRVAASWRSQGRLASMRECPIRGAGTAEGYHPTSHQGSLDTRSVWVRMLETRTRYFIKRK